MEEKVIKIFEKLKIDYEVIHHLAIFKEKDEENTKVDFKGATVCKNLLLKPDKTEDLYLACLPLTKKADLKKIQNQINSRRLSFAKEEDLTQNLGIKSGSASVLNIIEKPNTKVEFLLDNQIRKCKTVAFHPNTNTASIIFLPKHIDTILNYYNAKYRWLEM